MPRQKKKRCKYLRGDPFTRRCSPPRVATVNDHIHIGKITSL